MGTNTKKRPDDKRGSVPGERRGGRQLGSQNIGATLKRSEEVEAELKAQGRKPAKEILRKYMEMFDRQADLHKPVWGEPLEDGTQVDLNPFGDEEAYHHYSSKAVEVATRLVPYEAPTFRSINIPAPPPELPEPGQESRRKFTLHVFDNQGRPPPPQAPAALEPPKAKDPSE